MEELECGGLMLLFPARLGFCGALEEGHRRETAEGGESEFVKEGDGLRGVGVFDLEAQGDAVGGGCDDCGVLEGPLFEGLAAAAPRGPEIDEDGLIGEFGLEEGLFGIGDPGDGGGGSVWSLGGLESMPREGGIVEGKAECNESKAPIDPAHPDAGFGEDA